MKPEELFLSIEQCEHLQELGLDMSDAAFCWVLYPNKECYRVSKILSHSDRKILEQSGVKDIVPTYTLQEVLGKLPEEIVFKDKDGFEESLSLDIDSCYLYYHTSFGLDSNSFGLGGETLLDAAYKMLCLVLEKGYYKEVKG